MLVRKQRFCPKWIFPKLKALSSDYCVFHKGVDWDLISTKFSLISFKTDLRILKKIETSWKRLNLFEKD
jgi:hypothetical protein